MDMIYYFLNPMDYNAIHNTQCSIWDIQYVMFTISDSSTVCSVVFTSIAPQVCKVLEATDCTSLLSTTGSRDKVTS